MAYAARITEWAASLGRDEAYRTLTQASGRRAEDVSLQTLLDPWEGLGQHRHLIARRLQERWLWNQPGTPEHAWTTPTAISAAKAACTAWDETIRSVWDDEARLARYVDDPATWLRDSARDLSDVQGDRWRDVLGFNHGCGIDYVGVGPIGRHRDSEPLDQSNFRVILSDLQRIDDRVMEVRFGHWGFGWTAEITLPLDNQEVINRVTFWRESLERYPAADDRDVAELEAELAADIEHDNVPDEAASDRDGPRSDARQPGDHVETPTGDPAAVSQTEQSHSDVQSRMAKLRQHGGVSGGGGIEL